MEQIDVDTMSLSGDAVLWLSVNGDDAPFDATGHYPILAGYDSSGNPLFVAAVRIEFLCYFAPVTEGASTLTYQDELGDEHVSHDFFVLALRHDPFDTSPPYPRARAGAIGSDRSFILAKLLAEEGSGVLRRRTSEGR